MLRQELQPNGQGERIIDPKIRVNGLKFLKLPIELNAHSFTEIGVLVSGDVELDQAERLVLMLDLTQVTESVHRFKATFDAERRLHDLARFGHRGIVIVDVRRDERNAIGPNVNAFTQVHSG